MPVTRFEITQRRSLADGESFGDVGPYEEIRGRIYFAVDPEHDANLRVTDIGLAPRNSDGLVEFSSDVVMLKPANGEAGSRRILFDVLNRGRRVCLQQFNNGPRYIVTPDTPPAESIGIGNGWLMRNGWTVVWTGWQADPPPWPALNRLYVPEALDSDGNQLTGKIFSQFQSAEPVPHFMLSDRDHTPHPANNLDQHDALMTVRHQPDSEPTEIPRSSWSFARFENGEVVPDADYVCLDGGFEPGLMYQLTYTTVGAPLMGLGFLAMRDSVSFLRHGTEEDGNPSAGQIDHAYSFGVSQSGRFLRTFLYLDLNQDEEGREAFDGIIPHVPGGMRGEFNQRFGQPSKDLPSVLAQLFPFTPGESIDIDTEERGALLQRLRQRGASIKVFFSNTAAEYWRGDASLIHTDPDGREDAEPGDNVRIYALAGAQHGHGDWPPTDARSADGLRGQNLINSIDYAPLMRAQLENLHRWAADGVEPPPSSYPRIADGTAAKAYDVARNFDAIPDSNPPGHVPVPRRVDFGKDDAESRVTSLPPTPGRAYGSIVSDVDEDGNEIAGVKVPDVLVPLATSTPWNLRHPTMGAPDQVIGLTGGLSGSTLPFPRTAMEREDSGDPRRSIEERYSSKQQYLEQVRAAAVEQVEQRYMVEEDIERTVERAAERWDWFSSANRGKRDSRMRIGAIFPQTEIGSDPGGVRDYAQAVEAMGFTHILAFDHVIGADLTNRPDWKGPYNLDSGFHEPFVLFGYLAGITKTVELTTGIIILPQRQTVLVAKQAAALDVLSGGRLRLGIGLGWNEVEFEALNEEFGNRGSRAEEQIELMRALWTENSVDFKGKWHRVSEAGLNPMPVQQPIPVWMGGGASEFVRRRIARLADGWMPLMTPDDKGREVMEVFRGYLSEYGRPVDEFGIEGWVKAGSGDAGGAPAKVDAWRALGATHVSVNTMGEGLSGAAAHIKRLEEFRAAVPA